MPLTELFSVFGMLVGFGLILFLAWWFVRLLGRGVAAAGPQRMIQVLDRVSLGADKQLLLVRAGGRVLLLGVTAHRVENLAELPPDALPPQQPLPAEGGSFLAALKKALDTRKKGGGGSEDGLGEEGPRGPQGGD